MKESYAAGFGVVARLLTGGVWVLAGLLKLPDPAASVRAVRAYDLLPEQAVTTVGHLLPLVEVVVGLCLLAGLVTRLSATVSALLFVAFIVGIASAWSRGLEIDCGCFGGGGPVAAGATRYGIEMLRDTALLLVAAGLALWPASRLALSAPAAHAPTDAEKEGL